MYNNLTVYIEMTDVKLLELYQKTWNHWTVCKQIIGIE